MVAVPRKAVGMMLGERRGGDGVSGGKQGLGVVTGRSWGGGHTLTWG